MNRALTTHLTPAPEALVQDVPPGLQQGIHGIEYGTCEASGECSVLCMHNVSVLIVSFSLRVALRNDSVKSLTPTKTIRRTASRKSQPRRSPLRPPRRLRPRLRSAEKGRVARVARPPTTSPMRPQRLRPFVHLRESGPSDGWRILSKSTGLWRPRLRWPKCVHKSWRRCWVPPPAGRLPTTTT